MYTVSFYFEVQTKDEVTKSSELRAILKAIRKPLQSLCTDSTAHSQVPSPPSNANHCHTNQVLQPSECHLHESLSNSSIEPECNDKAPVYHNTETHASRASIGNKDRSDLLIKGAHSTSDKQLQQSTPDLQSSATPTLHSSIPQKPSTNFCPPSRLNTQHKRVSHTDSTKQVKHTNTSQSTSESQENENTKYYSVMW